MQKQNSIRVLVLLRYLYLRTDEEHPATIADMLDYLIQQSGGMKQR